MHKSVDLNDINKTIAFHLKYLIFIFFKSRLRFAIFIIRRKSRVCLLKFKSVYIKFLDIMKVIRGNKKTEISTKTIH